MTTVGANVPKAFFFDIYTQPGFIYSPMNLEVTMPETIVGNSVPAATICSVKVLYAGIYSKCVQQEYVNSLQTSYLQRMIQFKYDKAIVSLGTFCNTGDSTQDPMDGLIRFCNKN